MRYKVNSNEFFFTSLLGFNYYNTLEKSKEKNLSLFVTEIVLRCLWQSCLHFDVVILSRRHVVGQQWKKDSALLISDAGNDCHCFSPEHMELSRQELSGVPSERTREGGCRQNCIPLDSLSEAHWTKPIGTENSKKWASFMVSQR